MRMGKLLTVSVAAYGVEQYIRNTLDSIVNCGRIDDIEILVNDDGGKDNTLAIVKEYEEKYPGSVIAVHKENGGYGSVINKNVELATGKFFKQLDGDDWFDTDNIDKYMDVLDKTDADIVITVTNEVYEDEGRTNVRDRFSEQEEGLYDFSSFPLTVNSSMHSTTYKTEILRHEDCRITEGMFYTDVEYLCNPLKYADKVYVTHIPLYCYRLGREGQSVSKTGYLKHLGDLDHLLYKLMDIRSRIPSDAAVKRAFMQTRLRVTFNLVVQCHLLLPPTKENKEGLRKIFGDLKAYDKDLYDKIISTRKYNKILDMSNFALYRPVRVIINRRWK